MHFPSRINFYEKISIKTFSRAAADDDDGHVHMVNKHSFTSDYKINHGTVHDLLIYLDWKKVSQHFNGRSLLSNGWSILQASSSSRRRRCVLTHFPIVVSDTLEHWAEMFIIILIKFDLEKQTKFSGSREKFSRGEESESFGVELFHEWELLKVVGSFSVDSQLIEQEKHGKPEDILTADNFLSPSSVKNRQWELKRRKFRRSQSAVAQSQRGLLA